MPRGRPKGSKNKTTIKSETVEKAIVDAEKPEEEIDTSEEIDGEEDGEAKGGLVLGKGEYRLTTNKYNVILQVLTKNGTYRNWKFYSDPHNALYTILDQTILETGFGDMGKLLAAISEIKEMINAIPNNVLPQMGSK